MFHFVEVRLDKVKVDVLKSAPCKEKSSPCVRSARASSTSRACTATPAGPRSKASSTSAGSPTWNATRCCFWRPSCARAATCANSSGSSAFPIPRSATASRRCFGRSGCPTAHHCQARHRPARTARGNRPWRASMPPRVDRSSSACRGRRSRPMKPPPSCGANSRPPGRRRQTHPQAAEAAPTDSGSDSDPDEDTTLVQLEDA